MEIYTPSRIHCVFPHDNVLHMTSTEIPVTETAQLCTRLMIIFFCYKRVPHHELSLGPRNLADGRLHNAISGCLHNFRILIQGPFCHICRCEFFFFGLQSDTRDHPLIYLSGKL